MTRLKIYQVDAFTDRIFKGNPAAIVPLDRFLAARTMQAIAAENNLAETAFFVKRKDGEFNLRWFTPTAEVDFCGHATVASAHILISEFGTTGPVIFHTQVGRLEVSIAANRYVLKSPTFTATNIDLTEDLRQIFDRLPKSGFRAKGDIYLICDSNDDIATYQPDFPSLKTLSHSLDAQGFIITAQGGSGKFKAYDFVSRYFAPAVGIDEDPVTGSIHASLMPYWSERLGKTDMTAHQASPRGGDLGLKISGDEVLISGHAVTYMRGEIVVPASE